MSETLEEIVETLKEGIVERQKYNRCEKSEISEGGNVLRGQLLGGTAGFAIGVVAATATAKLPTVVKEGVKVVIGGSTAAGAKMGEDFARKQNEEHNRRCAEREEKAKAKRSHEERKAQAFADSQKRREVRISELLAKESNAKATPPAPAPRKSSSSKWADPVTPTRTPFTPAMDVKKKSKWDFSESAATLVVPTPSQAVTAPPNAPPRQLTKQECLNLILSAFMCDATNDSFRVRGSFRF